LTAASGVGVLAQRPLDRDGAVLREAFGHALERLTE
jgi:hypothetical protein